MAVSSTRFAVTHEYANADQAQGKAQKTLKPRQLHSHDRSEEEDSKAFEDDHNCHYEGGQLACHPINQQLIDDGAKKSQSSDICPLCVSGVQGGSVFRSPKS